MRPSLLCCDSPPFYTEEILLLLLPLVETNLASAPKRDKFYTPSAGRQCVRPSRAAKPVLKEACKESPLLAAWSSQ